MTWQCWHRPHLNILIHEENFVFFFIIVEVSLRTSEHQKTWLVLPKFSMYSKEKRVTIHREDIINTFLILGGDPTPQSSGHGLYLSVGRVLSFFSSRRNWDSLNPLPAESVPPPPPLVPGGGATLVSERGMGESQFQRGDIHCGTQYKVCKYFVLDTVRSRSRVLLPPNNSVSRIGLGKWQNSAKVASEIFSWLLMLCRGTLGLQSSMATPQRRQSAKLFLQSSELGLPQLLTRRRVCPPPHPVLGGGAHSTAREGLGESQLRWGDILVHCGTVKSGNFVTFFAQNIFFHKIMWSYPIFFSGRKFIKKNCFRC